MTGQNPDRGIETPIPAGPAEILPRLTGQNPDRGIETHVEKKKANGKWVFDRPESRQGD